MGQPHRSFGLRSQMNGQIWPCVPKLFLLLPKLLLCSMPGENLLRPAKSGNDWTNSLLSTSKSRMRQQLRFSTWQLFPRHLYPRRFSIIWQSRLVHFQRLIRTFSYTCGWQSLGPPKNRLSTILLSSSYLFYFSSLTRTREIVH